MRREFHVRFCEGLGVRFPRATRLVLGFQHRKEAERFSKELVKRLARFNLELHPDKTRLIEFGRYAIENRSRRGAGKPESFDFLGFTHSCTITRVGGWYAVRRQTMRKRMRAKLQEVKTTLRRRMHDPVPAQGLYLRSVMRGHSRYYGVPGNSYALQAFRAVLARHWWKTLNRRSQGRHVTWSRIWCLMNRWVPSPRICHPYPTERLQVIT
jgi:RNA-directed DNA polymerase